MNTVGITTRSRRPTVKEKQEVESRWQPEDEKRGVLGYQISSEDPEEGRR